MKERKKKKQGWSKKIVPPNFPFFFHIGRTCAPPPTFLTRLRGLLSSQIDVLIHSAPMRPGRGYLVATWSWPRLDVDSGQDRPPFTFTCIYDTKCSSSTRGSYFWQGTKIVREKGAEGKEKKKMKLVIVYERKGRKRKERENPIKLSKKKAKTFVLGRFIRCVSHWKKRKEKWDERQRIEIKLIVKQFR